jgi:hypothetical protein
MHHAASSAAVGSASPPARASRIDSMLIRYVFYAAYYLINVLLSRDLVSTLLTVPTFAVIFATLRFCPRRQIGQLDMVALIYFLFFCIVPLQQVERSIFTFGEIYLLFRYDYLDFAIVHALAIISYLLLVAGVARSSQQPAPAYSLTPLGRPLLFGLAVVAALAGILVQGGVAEVLTPRYLKQDSVLSQAAPLFGAIQSIATLLYLIDLRRSRSPFDWAAVATLIALLLLMANPFNTARFVLLGVWGPIALLTVPILLRPVWFYLVSLFMLIIAVPLLSLSTRVGLVDAQEVSSGLTFGSFFTLKNLNVFELCLEVIAYTRHSGLRWGETFVSTVFAHVPRAWWPEKPIASNLEVGANLVSFFRFTNENMAVPWFMDGYLDFGVAGAIAYAALAGGVLYVLNRQLRYTVEGVELYSLVMISNFLILARGTLAVVFSLFLFQIITLSLLRRTLLECVGPIRQAGFDARAGRSARVRRDRDHRTTDRS